MELIERNSLNHRRRAVITVAVITATLLAGCTTEAPAKPTPGETAAAITAWLEDRPDVLQVEEAPGFHDDDIVLEVKADPGIDDAEIRAIGDFLATSPRSLNVSVDISAGDDTWSSSIGSDSTGIVETVIWLRNDPRVTSADVDSLSADGAVAIGDVFDTAADFHRAMQGLDISTRLIIEQSEVGVGLYGQGTQVETVAEKPYPSEAVEAAQSVLAAHPTSTVSVSLVEGSYELKTRATFDTSIDIADARRVATDAFGGLLPTKDVTVTVGPAIVTLDELTDDRIPFVRAMIATADVTEVRFGGPGFDGPDFTVTGSAASWAAANDAAVATLVEPSLGRWVFGEVRVQAPTLAAGDPYRIVIPALAALTHARSIVYTKGELLVELAADVDDPELSALVAAVRQAGLASTIVLSLSSYDDDDSHTWAKVVDGVIEPENTEFAELRERFAAIWAQ